MAAGGISPPRRDLVAGSVSRAIRPQSRSSTPSARSAAIELVRAALVDPVVRDEIRTIAFIDHTSPQAEMNEPLIDAREAGKLLGMSPAAARAAAYRGTLPSVHVGRLLRFRRSALLHGGEEQRRIGATTDRREGRR